MGELLRISAIFEVPSYFLGTDDDGYRGLSVFALQPTIMEYISTVPLPRSFALCSIFQKIRYHSHHLTFSAFVHFDYTLYKNEDKINIDRLHYQSIKI